MVLPSCKRCGASDPRRMHGLMTLWFGPLIELEADLGYFYLCPACHDEVIVPELERIQNRILELHPAAQRHLEELEGHERPGAAGHEAAAPETGASQAGNGPDDADDAGGTDEAGGAGDDDADDDERASA